MTQKTFYVASDGTAFIPYSHLGKRERVAFDLGDLQAVFVKNNKEAYEACLAYENESNNTKTEEQ